MKQPKSDSVLLNALERMIERREFLPIYLFYGDEDFLIEESLQMFIAAAVDEATKSFNLDIVYGSDVDAKQVMALAASFPMMAERRVVIVREFEKLTNKDPLLSYLDHPSPTTSLVLITSKPDFRQKFYKTLKEQGILVEFKSLYENDVPQWINKTVERRGKIISYQACQLIQNYVGRSLREIYNEIEKLFIYVGDKKAIDVDDINAIVGMSRQFNVFELQNAIGAKNISRALEILTHMLNAGEQPTSIIVMLTRYFQKLWLMQDCLARHMSDDDIAVALKISPKQMYFLQAEKQTAKRFTAEELNRSFAVLREADTRLKSSNGETNLVMTLLLYHILNKQGTMVAA